MTVTGKMVETARKSKKWRQEELAGKIGTSRTYMSHIENTLKIPKKMIPRLDKVFGGQTWRAPKPENGHASLQAIATGEKELTLESILTILLDHEQRLESVEVRTQSGIIRMEHGRAITRDRIRRLIN